ncbi:MAG: hypothetical protein M9928_21665 [Anaerolineae bacterium]|nr:hypothetical protein [Anaerolineae bacterium]MCO5195477.1 hypothetical protein [Anaerolineae bacterium]MCO5207624.1 hypothetical protein [Anaerolineae bacterium]
MDTLALVILQTAFVLAVAAIALSGSAYYARAYVRKQMVVMQELHEQEIAKLQEQLNRVRQTAYDEVLESTQIMQWTNYVINTVRTIMPEKSAVIMNFDAWKQHRTEQDERNARVKAADLTGHRDTWSLE